MKQNLMEKPDVTVQDEGSIFVLYPQTDNGETWIEENLCQNDSPQIWGCKGVVVEHRYVSAILQGMVRDNLVIGGAQ